MSEDQNLTRASRNPGPVCEDCGPIDSHVIACSFLRKEFNFRSELFPFRGDQAPETIDRRL